MKKTWSLAGRVAICALGAVVVFHPACASQRHRSSAAALQSHQKPVTYEADGTPIATGAPRRLSALAVGGSAWATFHEMRARRHRQQVAKLQPTVR